MKKITKKLTSLILALLLASSPVSVFSAQPALTAELLAQNSAKAITRGEFAMLLNSVLSLPASEGEGFDDVPQDHPYAADILTAQALGYMQGDGTGVFRPDDIISGAEASVAVNFFLGFDLSKVTVNTLTSAPGWAKASVSNLLDLGMTTLQSADKKTLTAADAIQFANALAAALMFRGGPYALAQTDEKDDFFGYTTRQYLATAALPPGYPFAMAFTAPELEVQKQSAALLAEILASDAAPGSAEQKIKDLHKMYMDEKGRAASIDKLTPVINEIKGVKTVAELNALAKKHFKILNLLGFYGLSVNRDARADATKWCVIILPGGFSLGSGDYYADTAELAPVHAAFKKYLADVLAYAGETENLTERAEAVFAVEQGNAHAAMPMAQLNNPDVIYKLSSWTEMDSVAKNSDTTNYDPEMRKALKNVNVYCPDMDYIKHVESLYTEENLNILKDFAIINTVRTFSAVIGDDFSELSKELQIAMLGQATEKLSLEARAQAFVTNLMSRSFSQLYAQKYVSPKDKADITEIAELIRSKYRERIAALDWMSDETKTKASEKLDAIKVYVAYPDSYESRYDFDVKAKEDGGNLIDFFIDYSNSVYAKQIEMFSKPYDLTLWESVPTYTVNAFYSATENAVIIPAGILQAPFYTKGAKREANLGGIGGIIAHEFTHAFDNNGAQYDKNGTISNWWAADDYSAFGKLTNEVAAALSDIKFVGEQHVNGALCVGETIADMGALACVLDIADDMDSADTALAMRSWTGIWASKMSTEVTAYLLATDFHAPHKLRANFTLSHLTDFYDTFSITESDGMYTAPEKRINIW